MSLELVGNGGDVATQPQGMRGRTLVLLALVFLVGFVLSIWQAASEAYGELASSQGDPPSQAGAAAPGLLEALPAGEQTGLKIGLVAGHWKHDSGAVCPDGLQEVDINLAVASQVASILAHQGYDVEVLPEFSRKLKRYRAAAFVSIHADSCDVPDASGFKVARLAESVNPDQDDHLVACLVQEYAAVTGLRFHMNSITPDMTDYHGFGEIDAATPGAIIELGFMGADRELLTTGNADAAQGVARGILCFLRGP
jgi:N-acetylmuramoyl-L-alanine amidase